MDLQYRPLPDLEETLRELYEETNGILSEEEVTRNKELIPTYVALLKEPYKYLSQRPNGWVDESMIRSYLLSRMSLPFYSNYAILWKEDLDRTDLASRTASIVMAGLDFYIQEKKGKLKPDTIRGMPLGMEQYHRLFGSVHIPGASIDSIHNYPDARHVMIACRGQFYEIPVDLANSKAGFSTWKQVIERILVMSFQKEEVGVLTSLPRNEWYLARQLLLNSEVNKETIQKIEESIFLLCLDPEVYPHNLSEGFTHIQHGCPENRWFDKSHQIIVSPGLGTGICIDHTFIDGFASSRYANEVSGNAKGISLEANETSLELSFQKLNWEITSEVKREIKKAKEYYEKEMSFRELNVFSIQIPKTSELKNSGISQDAFLQTGIHLGLYFFEGRALSINEAVLMTHFKEDRYDTAYTVTKEILEFIELIKSKSATIEDLIKISQAHKNRLNKTIFGKSPVHFLTSLICFQEPGRMQVGFKGIEDNGKVCVFDSSLNKFLDVEATTSSLPQLPNIHGFSFTDYTSGVIGMAYVPGEGSVQIALKVDGHLHSSAKKIEEKLREAFHTVNELFTN